MEIEVETKRIGGSLGIIIPHNVVEMENIKPKEKIVIELKRAHTVGDIFGKIKWTKTTEEMMKEVRKGWK